MVAKTSSKPYLDWVRSLPCAVSTRGCDGIVTAHHVRRFGEKKQDYRAVPLCCAHHLATWGPDAVHQMGRRNFERRFGLDFEALIIRLNEVWQKASGKAA